MHTETIASTMNAEKDTRVALICQATIPSGHMDQVVAEMVQWRRDMIGIDVDLYVWKVLPFQQTSSQMWSSMATLCPSHVCF